VPWLAPKRSQQGVLIVAFEALFIINSYHQGPEAFVTYMMEYTFQGR
jgi:hypothetical protein